MPVTEGLQSVGGFTLDLDPATPRGVLDRIDVRSRLWSTYLLTSQHIEPGDASDADILAMARYCGVYLGMGRGRTSIDGDGLAFWFGGDGDGGYLYTGVDTPILAYTFNEHLGFYVFNFFAPLSNGLTQGITDPSATTFTWDLKAGDTRREILDTLCAQAPAGPFYWRINPDFSVDAGTLVGLWPSTDVPTALFTADGGGEGSAIRKDAAAAGSVVGIQAAMVMEGLDGREVRSKVTVDWNAGTTDGTATNPLPATYANLTGAAPVHEFYMTDAPKRPQPPTEKWRKLVAWQVKSQNRATAMAVREADERAVVRPKVTAQIGDYDPWRFDASPGNTVYLHDPAQGLTDPAHEVYYRGEAIHPSTGRVEEWTVPIREGYGSYLRCWNGAAFEYIDLTPYAVPEVGPTRVSINHREPFPLGAAIGEPLSQAKLRQWTRDARQAAQILAIAAAASSGDTAGKG